VYSMTFGASAIYFDSRLIIIFVEFEDPSSRWNSYEIFDDLDELPRTRVSVFFCVGATTMTGSRYGAEIGCWPANTSE